MKLLIDGDMVIHKSTVAVEKDLRFDGRYHILMSDFVDARCLMEDMLHELREQSNLDDLIFVLSDPEENFRKIVAKGDYKANRKNTRKPLAYWHLREFVEEHYDCKMLPTLEADDTMGLMQTKYPEDYAIWSGDKDLMQIPGLHLLDDELLMVTEDEGTRFFYQQILAGDPTDGYSGCPRVGNVKALKILDAIPDIQDTKSVWDIIVATYVKAGATAEDALFNAQMARILRHGEYTKGVVKLWQPPE